MGCYIESDPVGLAAGVNTYGYVKGNPLTWSDAHGLAIGDFPTLPSEYDPLTWAIGKYENTGRWFLQDPEGNRFIAHAEDWGHWRHWDKQDKNGGDDGTCPSNSRKPWPGQKRNLKPSQAGTDPSGDAPPWSPPSSDYFIPADGDPWSGIWPFNFLLRPLFPAPIAPVRPVLPLEPVFP